MTFNRQLAIWCGERIAALYAKQVTPNVVDRASDTQVLIEKLVDGAFAIVFPGTASFTDMRTDVRTWKQAWLPAGKVHNGFRLAYRSVAEGIKQMLPPQAPLVITGHSLGGALATLCAHDLAAQNFTIANVITFGSPRVGNGPFARDYNWHLRDVTARIVNAQDPIPHVPWMLGTYRHVDTQVYLPQGGGVLVDQTTRAVYEELKVQTAQVMATQEQAALVSLHAHHITSYLQKLKA